MAFLEAQGIVKSYEVGQTRITVLRDLDLKVEKGEMVAIVGASGVGKSTLLHVLGGLDRVDRGTVSIDGTELTSLDDQQVVRFRNRQVGFVFQFHHLLPEFDARENTEMPMRRHRWGQFRCDCGPAIRLTVRDNPRKASFFVTPRRSFV